MLIVWFPKPDSPLGRFIIDCSYVNKGRVPLNGLTSKDKGIARYQKVVLPSLLQILICIEYPTSWSGQI